MSPTLTLAVITWLQQKIAAGRSLVQDAAILIVIVMVAVVAWKTKQLVPIIVTALLGGLVLFFVFNPTWLMDQVRQEALAPALQALGHVEFRLGG